MLIIRDWNSVFENNRSRVLKDLSWVPMPNKHDGAGYIELLTGHADGPAHYACWLLIVQVASKCRPRGTLVRNSGTAHTAASIAAQVRVPAALMEIAIRRLLSPDIAWLSENGHAATNAPSGTQVPESGTQVPESRRRMEGKGMEGKGMEGNGREGMQGKGRAEQPALEREPEKAPETATPPAPVLALSAEPPPPSPKPDYLGEAEGVLDIYPRRTGLDAALPVVIRLLKGSRKKAAVPANDLYLKTAEYACCRFVKTAKERGGERFIPHPKTWYGQGRYADDPSEWAREWKP